jgi:predicted acylesterase/phospholipase RssA
VIERLRRIWQRRSRPKLALALGGGGVIGGMYEVGVLAAIEERLPPGNGRGFDIYVGCSAGAVVASVMANGISASELYGILDRDLPDPLNFQRHAVYARDSFRRAFFQFARFVWAVGKNAVTGVRSSIPDMLARAERDFPAGFFSLAQLEQYMRGTFAARGLVNSFAALRGTLLIPAVDLDRAERVVFGCGALADVPISEAVAASSAIPGFFEPFRINGRDYVDGGVGFSGHADIAADAGADLVVVVNPLVPAVYEGGGASIRQRGMYFIMEQTNRIYTQNLLRQNLDAVATRYPKAAFFVIQPPPSGTPLFGPSMGFEASRAALRYGLTSTRQWLDAAGADVVRRITVQAVPTTA